MTDIQPSVFIKTKDKNDRDAIKPCLSNLTLYPDLYRCFYLNVLRYTWTPHLSISALDNATR